MQKRVLLPVKRFTQRPSECAVAAASSLAHYYDPSVDYKSVRQLISNKQEGLWSSQQARLLNKLGFVSITIVTADLNMVDFSWSKLSKARKISRLRERAKKYGRRGDAASKEWVDDMVGWLSDEACDNRLVIDWDFAKHIRRGLDAGRPVGATISWNSFFRKAGSQEDHAIVLRGYDETGVFVVDSHVKYYRGRLKKFKNGYYKIPWEKFLVNIPNGDLIIIR